MWEDYVKNVLDCLTSATLQSPDGDKDITGETVDVSTNNVSLDNNGRLGPFKVNSNWKIYGIKFNVKVNNTDANYYIVNDEGYIPYDEELHDGFYYSTYNGDIYIQLEDTQFLNSGNYTVSVSGSGIYHQTTATY